LSAPAFFAVLPTVLKTSAPFSNAMSAVSSVQLSHTTSTRSGTLDWRRSDQMVAAIDRASLWAGMTAMSWGAARGEPR
jgi:hypothetical protein